MSKRNKKGINRLTEKVSVWLKHYGKGNDCSGRMSFTSEWEQCKSGLNAMEALYHYESSGKRLPTKEIKVLERYLQAKATLDLNVKSWATDRAKGLLGSIEFNQIIKDLDYPLWVAKAVENQKRKIQKKHV